MKSLLNTVLTIMVIIGIVLVLLSPDRFGDYVVFLGTHIGRAVIAVVNAIPDSNGSTR